MDVRSHQDPLIHPRALHLEGLPGLIKMCQPSGKLHGKASLVFISREGLSVLDSGKNGAGHLGRAAPRDG